MIIKGVTAWTSGKVDVLDKVTSSTPSSKLERRIRGEGKLRRCSLEDPYLELSVDFGAYPKMMQVSRETLNSVSDVRPSRPKP